MKNKFLIPIIASIAIGFIFGKVFFNQYENNSLTTFNEGEKTYFISIGTYSSLREIKDQNNYLVLLQNDGYHVYTGITQNKKNCEKIQEIYKEIANNTYVEEIYLTNQNFLNILKEYDKIVSFASNEDIKSIEKIVISNYKEMVKDYESTN